MLSDNKFWALAAGSPFIILAARLVRLVVDGEVDVVVAIILHSSVLISPRLATTGPIPCKGRRIREEN